MAPLTAEQLLDKPFMTSKAKEWLGHGDPKLCTVLLLNDWIEHQEESLNFMRYLKAVYADGNACKRPLLPLPPILAVNALFDCTPTEAVTLILRHLHVDCPPARVLESRQSETSDTENIDKMTALLAEKDVSLVNREKALERILKHHYGFEANADDVSRFVRAEPEVVYEEVIEKHQTIVGISGVPQHALKKHSVKDLFKHKNGSHSTTLSVDNHSIPSSSRLLIRPLSSASLREGAVRVPLDDPELDSPDSASTADSSNEIVSTCPFTNLAPAETADGTPGDMPDTTNQLSKHEKRALVHRTHKLNKVLGVPIEDLAVPEVIVENVPIGRIDSLSPTVDSRDSTAALSPSKDWRKMSIPGQPDYYFEEFAPPLAAIKESRQFTALGMTPAVAREERRRKLDKLHRILGERVPQDIILNESHARAHGKSENSSNMSRSRSGLGDVWGKLVGKRKHHERQHDRRESWPDEAGTQSDTTCHSHAEPSAPPSSNGADVVNRLNRARKLEQVFGDLPPASLYVPRRKHARSQSHSHVETVTRVRSRSTYRSSVASLHYLAEHDPEALVRLTSDYIRKSFEELPLSSTRRDSAANDADAVVSPDSVNVADLTLADSDSGDDDDDDGGGDDTTESAKRKEEAIQLRSQIFSRETQYSSTSSARELSSPVSPLSSGMPAPASTVAKEDMPSHRRSESLDELQSKAVKKAHKLASFFGTTRGEVWQRLLDDLEHAIIEEEDVPDDERQEVLDAVVRLRDHVI